MTILIYQIDWMSSHGQKIIRRARRKIVGNFVAFRRRAGAGHIRWRRGLTWKSATRFSRANCPWAWRSRRKLAAELNISVPPVIEALQRLEREDLVESKPRVGTRVRIPTRQDIEDRSLVREALETQAARLFAERATAAEKKELRQMGRRVDQLYAAAKKVPTTASFIFRQHLPHEAASARRGMCALPGLARCHREGTGADLQLALRHRRATAFIGLELSRAPDRHPCPLHAHAAEAAMRKHIRHGLQEVLSGLARMAEAENRWRQKKNPKRLKS